LKWRVYFGIAISVLFLFLAFRKVHLPELKDAIRSANYIYLLPAVFLSFLSLWIRSLRWMYIFQPIKKIKICNLFSVTMIGFMANNLLPARMGEFIRAYLIGKKEQISKISSLATIVVERIFDGVTLLFFLLFVLILYSFHAPMWLRNSLYAAGVLYIFAVGFLILLKVQPELALRFVNFLSHPFPKKFKQFLINSLGRFVEGLKVLQNPKIIIASTILSLLIWIPIALAIYCLLISFKIYLPVYVSFLLLGVLALGVMIPSAPGFVGTVQFVCVTVLSLFSVSKSQALSFSIVYHASQFIPITIVGMVYLWMEQASLRKIKESL